MKKEKRNLVFKDIEVRSIEEEGKRFVTGLIPYNSKSVPMWGTTEIIAPTAFNKTLADKSEVRAFFNHDDSKVLGSTKSETLELENTEIGLICRCELPNTSYANDLYEVINRGDVKTMSFGFIPQKFEDSEGGKIRTLKEVELLEVSFGVAFPAYPETNSIVDMRGFKKRNIDANKLNVIFEKETLEKEDKIIINKIIESLRNLIKEEAVEEETVEKEQENSTQNKNDEKEQENSTLNETDTSENTDEVEKRNLTLLGIELNLEMERKIPKEIKNGNSI